jgi:uncharacterized membrane protein YfcA
VIGLRGNNMHNIIIFILIGSVAGILSGIFGIGGGVVIIPGLIYLAGFTQLKAQGTSLAILLPPVGILAFMEYYKKGYVDVKAAIIICITVLLGAMIGSKIVSKIPVEYLRKGFAVFMIAVSLKMFFSK